MGSADVKKEYIRSRLRKDPVKFAELVVGVKLFPYQKKFLRDRSKRILFVGGRQVGKSTIVALRALWRAWCWSNQVVLIIAPTLRQSKLTFNKIRQFILRSKILMSDIEKLTLSEIRFSNGSSIHCLPSGHAGETIRGFTADMIIIDEGAYVPDEVYVAMMPSLAVKDGEMIIVGSPGGKSGYMWKAWNSPDWSKHHVPATKSPLISQDFIDEFRRTHTDVEYRREILAEFTDEDDTYFSIGAVHEVAKGKRWNEPRDGYRYFAGLDVARFGGDETALVIVAVGAEDEPIYMVNYYTRSRASLSDVIGWAKNIIEKWNVEVCAVDETGLGAGVKDVLEEQLGDRIWGITFTSRQRLEMYSTLRELIMDKKIVLLNDPKLIMQFSNYLATYSSSGHLVVRKKASGHDDIVDALALAVYVARMHTVESVEVAPEITDIVNLWGNVEGVRSRSSPWW